MKFRKIVFLGIPGLLVGILMVEILARFLLPHPLRQINLLRMRAPDLQMDAETDLYHLTYNPFIQRRPHSDWVCDGKSPEKMNNEGFRDKDFEKTPKENTLRIALIGDSFTEGWMAPRGDAYPFIVQRELENTVEVMNFGLANRSPLRYLVLYREIVQKYHPQVVLVCLYRNDVAEDEALRPYCRFDAMGVPTQFDFQRYFKNTPRMPQTRWEKRKDRLEWFFCKYSRIYPYAAIYLSVDPDFRRRILEAPPTSSFQPLWENTSHYLTILKHLAEENHSRLLLAYAPDLTDFKTEDPMHRALPLLANQNQIPLFNGDSFLNLPHPDPLYIKGDGHFSSEGHQIYGKQMALWLKKELNLP